MFRGVLTKVRPTDWFLGLLLVSLTIWLGYFVPRDDFCNLAVGLVLLFGAYLWILFRRTEVWGFYVWVGLAARLSLLFALPGLSDDVYRFIWDGRLWASGVNPFSALPSTYAEQGFPIPGLDQALYAKLNSPDYFTIYPPVPQLSFWLSVVLSPNSVFGSILVQRSLIFLAEAATIMYLLPRALMVYGKPLQRSLIYVLNPMIILEITGNLHHEGFVVFFLLLSWLGLRQKKWVSASLYTAGAICSKLLPLMFLPFIWRRAGFKNGLLFYVLTGLFSLLAFLPLYDPTFLAGFQESLDLYFRKFEFNGSLFYIVRWVGFQRVGYDVIQTAGPNLAKIVFLVIVALAALERRPRWGNLPPLCLGAIMVYLLGTTTVHPWYVTLPLVCCMFTSFRFPILWSMLIMGTYINYSYPEYHENLWVVGLEYTLVFGMMLYELVCYFRRKSS